VYGNSEFTYQIPILVCQIFTMSVRISLSTQAFYTSQSNWAYYSFSAHCLFSALIAKDLWLLYLTLQHDVIILLLASAVKLGSLFIASVLKCWCCHWLQFLSIAEICSGLY
jgi:hypothetical protein